MVAPVKDPVAQAKFLSKVEMTDTCWIWIPVRNRNVYGLYNFKAAHRAAYEIFIGPIPKGKILRHTCDVKNCVNPDHLIPGTHKENTADYLARQWVPKPKKKLVSILVSKAEHAAIRALSNDFKAAGLGTLHHASVYAAGLKYARLVLEQARKAKGA